MTLVKYIFGLLIFVMMLVGMYFLAMHQLATGYVDKYYPKFTQEAGSLIIGLSRAQYGLVPVVFENTFPEKAQPVVNFAFELYQSPYGEILLEDLKHKIKAKTNNGIFILEVSPASFLKPLKVSENMIYDLDSESILGKMEDVTSHPNYEYLRKCYGSALYKGVFRMKPFGNITVHDDGWVAFADHYDFYKVTDKMTQEWKTQTLDTYRKVVALQKKSPSRIQSFIKTIQFLKDHGTVYVVRMPVAKEILDFEKASWNDFSSEMDAIARKCQVPFFDYSKSHTDYKFYDGSHLFDTSAEIFTEQLCSDILKLN